MKLKVVCSIILSGLLFVAQAQIKIGIIGLDTSHAIAFTKFLNGEDKKEEFKDFKIVAAYPYGSKNHQVELRSYTRLYRSGEGIGCGDCSFHCRPFKKGGLCDAGNK